MSEPLSPEELARFQARYSGYADLFRDLEAAEARIAALTTTLVEAAIPLEALNADNYMGAEWMAPSIRASVAEAVAAIRSLVSDKPQPV